MFEDMCRIIGIVRELGVRCISLEIERDTKKYNKLSIAIGWMWDYEGFMG